jgi:hypothetical protein
MQDEKGKKKVPLAAILIFYILPILIAEIPFVLEKIYNDNFRYLIGYSLLLAIIVIIISTQRLGIGYVILNIAITFNIVMFTDEFIPAMYTKSERVAHLKANGHQISAALTEYASDHNGHFPSDTNVLVEESYKSSLPVNRIIREYQAIMEEIPFGSEPFEGNFTYVPVYEGEFVVGYYLIVYGYKNREGLDVNGDGIDDHVIMVLDSTGVANYYDEQRGHIAETEAGGSYYILPPLSELLD